MTLRLLRHRNIVQFYGASLEPDCLFIVTELLSGPPCSDAPICPAKSRPFQAALAELPAGPVHLVLLHLVSQVSWEQLMLHSARLVAPVWHADVSQHLI